MFGTTEKPPQYDTAGRQVMSGKASLGEWWRAIPPGYQLVPTGTLKVQRRDLKSQTASGHGQYGPERVKRPASGDQLARQRATAFKVEGPAGGSTRGDARNECTSNEETHKSGDGAAQASGPSRRDDDGAGCPTGVTNNDDGQEDHASDGVQRADVGAIYGPGDGNVHGAESDARAREGGSGGVDDRGKDSSSRVGTEAPATHEVSSEESIPEKLQKAQHEEMAAKDAAKANVLVARAREVELAHARVDEAAREERRRQRQVARRKARRRRPEEAEASMSQTRIDHSSESTGIESSTVGEQQEEARHQTLLRRSRTRRRYDRMVRKDKAKECRELREMLAKMEYPNEAYYVFEDMHRQRGREVIRTLTREEADARGFAVFGATDIDGAFERDRVRRWIELVLKARAEPLSNEDELVIGNMNEKDKDLLVTLSRNYPELLEPREGCPPMTTLGVRCEIHTGSDAPIKVRPRRYSQAEQAIIDKQVEKMLAGGAIKEICGDWGFPVVLFKKKDGAVRFCIDYRQRNAITKRDIYPLLRIDDTLDNLHGAGRYTRIGSARRSLVDSIRSFPVPSDAAGVKRFVHMAGYYRRFIPQFASKAAPLTRLLRKGVCGDGASRSKKLSSG
ncbi:unnamed protein product [Phytophthora fragariaefolia]|uniref:Unnamed protein product n=1 Tax=Phytophthora fragariaefolia TaxID=1490495 RepID=A0A9W6YBI7_9STRA|nr:unnamed protein product [Phytophthora fragariaefolia]